jgi:aldehyde dehydrogenase (NAD+)
MSKITTILSKQRAFFETHQTKDIDFRISQLKLLRGAIHLYEDRISTALKKDLNKCETEAYLAEIGYALGEITHTIKNLKRWAAPKKVKSASFFPLSKARVHYEPFGVALIISPWNYPFQLCIGPLVGAIAAGNCAVLKPSEISSNTAKVLQELIDDTFDQKYVAVIQGGVKTSTAILKEKWDYIFFTGSLFVGKIVMAAAAKHITPLTLELGGKSPCIVHDDASIDKAAKRIVWGKFLNAGQTCIAPDYVLVQESVKEELVSRMKFHITRSFGKTPLKSDDFGRMISDKQFSRVSKLMKSGKILFGGKTRSDEKYISPTLLEVTNPRAKIMQEEIFGPVLPILTYSSLNQALFFVNKRPKPLALYFFSNSKKLMNKVTAETSSGGMCCNDVLVHLSGGLPFGGVGESGFGKYHGKESIESFSNVRAVFTQTNVVDLGFRYPPYSTWAKKLIKLFMK